MSPQHDTYDFVIVGSGVAGALAACKLSQRAGVTVLIIEAGDEPALREQDASAFKGSDAQKNAAVSAHNREARKHLVESYVFSRGRGPLSPYERFESDHFAPSPEGSAKAQMERYYEFKQAEGDSEFFKATYQRILGGSTNSWRGNCPRWTPNDFLLKTKYGQGDDWPITYGDLEKHYCDAEAELGVSGDNDEWDSFNHGARRSRDFPMKGIPHSYSDQQVMARLEAPEVATALKSVPPFDKTEIHVLGTPQARNSRLYDNGGAQEMRPACEGNGNCIPVCPIKAKYDASVHLALARKQGVEILTHNVVASLEASPAGTIDKVHFIDWRSDDKKVRSVRARHVVLAAHGVENAKILLNSGLANSSDQVGRNLMDHLNSDVVGLFPDKQYLYTFRGPQGTASIPAFCDGPHRKDLAAFNITFGNDGWGRQEAPDKTLSDLLDKGLIGAELRTRFRDRLLRQLRFSYSSEQLPRPHNRVMLGHRNDLGIPRPLIVYKVDDYSRKAFAFAQGAIKHLLRSMGCTEIRPPTPGMDFNTAGHIMGTTRMGTDARTSVVDPHGRSWDHPNLYLLGGSVFTTGATANPTLTIAALTLRTIEAIGR